MARGWARLTAACLGERIECLAREGRLDEAKSSLDRMSPLLAADKALHVTVEVQRHFILARTRVDMSAGYLTDTIESMRHLHQKAAADGDLYLAVRLAIRLSEALVASGETATALETLARALEVGANVGLYQSFVDSGPTLGPLLCNIRNEISEEDHERRYLEPYLNSILNGWQTASNNNASRPSKLSGPLSPRECSILNLIRRGFSNKRVAKELGIAPETVKSHAKHIFVKLGAQTRVEAMSRAEQLGFI
jgi:LuxR family transcriptional regulator, maltose regulon positive regulatory protein